MAAIALVHMRHKQLNSSMSASAFLASLPSEKAMLIQRVFRGRQGRKFYKKHRSARDIRLNHAARLIQRHYRQWVATRKRRDTYGMAAKFDTGFPTEVVEAEAGG